MSTIWKITAIIYPLIWVLKCVQTLQTGCFGLANAGVVCGEDAIYPLIAFFLFCFAFPVVYFYKLIKTRDKDKN